MMNDDNMYEHDVLNDDLPGNNARYILKHRNDIRLNYESDSSFEDYNNNHEVKNVNEDEKADESNDDMFASDEDENDENDANDKIENTETASGPLDVESFEKDEFDDPISERYKLNPVYGSDGDIEYTEKENNPDNQRKTDYCTNTEYMDNIEGLPLIDKTKWTPKIEAFDLKEEAKEGTFDKDGNFIKNKEDDSGNEDEWMDMRKVDIDKTKKAQLERTRLEKERNTQESNNGFIPMDDVLSGLINLLEPVETPMEALARLAPPKRSKIQKRQQKNNEKDKERKRVVLLITDLCDKLINKAIVGTYELTKEELMRKYRQETGNDYDYDYDHTTRGKKRTRNDSEDEEVDYGNKIWEFKWNGQDKIHGPYSEYEMLHWSETYFENKVVVRKVGETEFKSICMVEFN